MHPTQLSDTVRVDRPDPRFARTLPRAVGGIEGEMRVMDQYPVQPGSFRGPARDTDVLLTTGTEEIGHIEMPATAAALNLDGVPAGARQIGADGHPAVAAAMDGQDPRHVLSAGNGAMAADSNGVPSNGSWVVSTGNLAADMHADITAEGAGGLLATRPYDAGGRAGPRSTARAPSRRGGPRR